MPGYRDTSNFDPYVGSHYARPLRPYNWVQWTGVGFLLVGLAIDILYFGGRFGWTTNVSSPALALPPIFLGISLINSRREQVSDPAPQLAAARKRWLFIVIAVCVVVFSAAIAISVSKGA